MAAIAKKATWLGLQFVANTEHSIHAGLVAVEAMVRRFDLRKKVRAPGCLDRRNDRKRGYGPEAIVGQLIYAQGRPLLSDSQLGSPGDVSDQLPPMLAGQSHVNPSGVISTRTVLLKRF